MSNLYKLAAEIERLEGEATPEWHLDGAVIWVVGMAPCNPECDPETGEPLGPSYEPCQEQLGGFGTDADAAIAHFARNNIGPALKALQKAVDFIENFIACNQPVTGKDPAVETARAALTEIEAMLKEDGV
jgi:hypothetical protein